MALPVAHVSFVWGFASSVKNRAGLTVLAFFSILPDFDFALVWALGLPMTLHRTGTHSIFFAAGVALLWKLLRPRQLAEISPLLVFAAVLSHSLIDLLCTADAADHGLMLFWPFSRVRFGWPVLVPLYLLVGDSPFSFWGAVRFTLLELILALPLWAAGRSIAPGFRSLERKTVPDRQRFFATEPE